VNVTADVVFAAFGITAPELHYDDYAGIDVKGKIVLLFVRFPMPASLSTSGTFFPIPEPLTT
jgi:hypothetical protein